MTNNDAPECRYSHDLEYRAIPGRHEDECQGAGPRWVPGLVWLDCPGCLECPEGHCASCQWRHGDGTCAHCLRKTRDTLEVIEDLCLRLPDEAVNLGAKSSAPGRNVLGGDPMVMLAMRYGDQNGMWAIDREHERKNDPVPPIVTLVGCEDSCRKALGHAMRSGESVGGAISYLEDHLHELGAADGELFATLSEDLSELKATLENVLTDGVRPERGAPCLQCGRPMERVEHKRNRSRDHGKPRRGHEREGAQDFYRCSPCNRVDSVAQYRYAVGAAYRAHAQWLTAGEITLQYGVPRGSVSGWATRGDVAKKRSGDGRTLYSVADVQRKLRGGDVEEQDEAKEESA